MTNKELNERITAAHFALEDIDAKIIQTKDDMSATYKSVQDFSRADAVKTDRAIEKLISLKSELFKLGQKRNTQLKRIEMLTLQVK